MGGGDGRWAGVRGCACREVQGRCWGNYTRGDDYGVGRWREGGSREGRRCRRRRECCKVSSTCAGGRRQPRGRQGCAGSPVGALRPVLGEAKRAAANCCFRCSILLGPGPTRGPFTAGRSRPRAARGRSGAVNLAADLATGARVPPSRPRAQPPPTP